jgi:hypothetical protein
MDMMVVRRAALDEMADLRSPVTEQRPFTDIRVDLGQHYGEDGLKASLVDAVADRLVRDDGTYGPGVAVVAGVSRYFELPVARLFHEVLFSRVWEQVRGRCGAESPGDHFRAKVTVTSDGAIPLELYGSEWSFKQMHMDRDALLFSHLYGPVTGFTGGALLLADVRCYMHRHGLRFDDLFEWSQEATPGRKPVLRAEYEDEVMAECGLEIGGVGPDEIIFINNFPSAGVLHGVTPVAVTDRASFTRTFHRCSVKGAPGCSGQPV